MHRTAHYLDPAHTEPAAQAVAVISYDAARSLRKAVSTETARPVLNLVHVRPDFLEATNGHVLIRIPTPSYRWTGDRETAPADWWERHDFPPRLVDVDALKTVKRKQCLCLDTASGALELREDPNEAAVPWGDLISRFAGPAPLASGTPGNPRRYPSTDPVFPNNYEIDGVRVSLSPEYWKRLGDVGKYLTGRDKGARIRLDVLPGKDGGSATRAVRVTVQSGNGVECLGLLMPMRELE